MRVGIAGASGYAGAELLRLCAGHPELEVVVAGADSQAGQPVSALYPSLAAAYATLEFSKAGAEDLAGLDVVFLALPHGESQELVPGLVGRVGVLVDLSADFRLRDPGAYPRWYGHEHTPRRSCSSAFVYGLPELFRAELAGAPLVAAPGCYPTAAALALGAARACRSASRRPASSWTPPAGCRARAASCRTRRTSTPSTRTSPPTGCCTTATRPRSSRPAGPRSCSRRTWLP